MDFVALDCVEGSGRAKLSVRTPIVEFDEEILFVTVTEDHPVQGEWAAGMFLDQPSALRLRDALNNWLGEEI